MSETGTHRGMLATKQNDSREAPLLFTYLAVALSRYLPHLHTIHKIAMNPGAVPSWARA